MHDYLLHPNKQVRLFVRLDSMDFMLLSIDVIDCIIDATAAVSLLCCSSVKPLDEELLELMLLEANDEDFADDDDFFTTGTGAGFTTFF